MPRIVVAGLGAVWALVCAASATAAPPEFGRCLKVAKGTGTYATAKCTEAGGERAFEWVAGPGPKSRFTTASRPETSVVIETITADKLICKSETGGGEVAGAGTVSGVELTFTGCESGSLMCESGGAPTGEVHWNELSGRLGVTQEGETALKDKVALDLGPVAFEVSCAGLPVQARGSVIEPVKTNAMMLSSTVKFAQAKGRQKPEGFEGEPKDVLELSFGGGPFEQAGLLLVLTQTNEEKIEVNTIV